MKRFLCIFIPVLLIFSCAFASSENEITFAGIPWLTQETEVMQTLKEKGYATAEASFVRTKSCYYLTLNTEDEAEQTENGTYSSACITTTLQGAARGKTGGYPIKDILLSYAYNGQTQLIYAEVILQGADYSELKQKLVKVYGDGKEYETALGYQITFWQGANNTGVLLYTYDDGLTCNLYYGRTDAEAILAKCLEVDPEDISGL